VTAAWPGRNITEYGNADDVENGLREAKQMNEAVIWDTIITSPSSDHLSNIGPVAKRKLIKSAEGKKIDPSRYVFLFCTLL
jgi:hypothetical protein